MLGLWTGNRHLLQDGDASGVASVTSSSHVRPPAVAGQSPADDNPYDTIATIAVNGEVRASPFPNAFCGLVSSELCQAPFGLNTSRELRKLRATQKVL